MGKSKVADKRSFGRIYFQVCALERARSDAARDVLIDLLVAHWNQEGETKFAFYMVNEQLTHPKRNFNYSTIGDPNDGRFVTPREAQVSNDVLIIFGTIDDL